MCTLIVAWKLFDRAPICVAANRDEARDRPSSPPSVRDRSGSPRIVAPRDERAGGTWIGYNEDGLLVAITNRWTAGVGDRSRGLLVDDALEASRAADAVACVEAELDARQYAPFHLLCVDDDDCLLVANYGDDHTRVRFEPGIHVVVNVGWDGDWFVPQTRPDEGRQQARNAERVHEELRPNENEDATGWLERAGDVLGDHDFGVCLHRNGFGTRSSSLIRLGNECTFAFADGPPCEADYESMEVHDLKGSQAH